MMCIKGVVGRGDSPVVTVKNEGNISQEEGEEKEPYSISLDDYSNTLHKMFPEEESFNYHVILDKTLQDKIVLEQIDLSPSSIFVNNSTDFVKKEFLFPDEKRRQKRQKSQARLEAAKKLDALERAGVSVDRPPSRADIPKKVFGTELELRIAEIKRKRFEHREALNRAAHERAVEAKRNVDPFKDAKDKALNRGAVCTMMRIEISGRDETRLRNKLFDTLPIIASEKVLSGFVMLLRKHNTYEPTRVLVCLTGMEKNINTFIKHISKVLVKHQQLFYLCSKCHINGMFDEGKDGKRVLKLYEKDIKELEDTCGVFCPNILRSFNHQIEYV